MPVGRSFVVSLAATLSLKQNDIEQPVSDVRFPDQWQSGSRKWHIHDLDTEEFAIEGLPVNLDRKFDRLGRFDSFFEQSATFS